MQPKVFICYRRSDSQDFVDRLSEHLSKMIPQENIFVDIKSIPIGFDFRDIIQETIEESHIVLAIIGNNWLEEIKNREKVDKDYVRVEIQKALETDTPLVPVLINGANMPNSSELPESIRGLGFMHSFEIDRKRFETDVELLSEQIYKSVNIKHDKEKNNAQSTGLLEAYLAWQDTAKHNIEKYPTKEIDRMLCGVGDAMQKCRINDFVERSATIEVYIYDKDDVTLLKDSIRYQWMIRELSTRLNKNVSIEFTYIPF